MFGMILNIPRDLSEYGKVLNRIGFSIYKDSEYGRVLNMPELHGVLNMSQYG